MNIDEIRAAAERLSKVQRSLFSISDYVPLVTAQAIARALPAALLVVEQARAHRDMEEAVAAFDKTIEGMKP